MKRRIGCCAAVRGTMNRTTFAAPTATGSRLSFSSTSSGFALCFRGLLSPFALFALFAFCRGTGAMPLSKIFLRESSRQGRAAHRPPIHRRERCGGPSGVNSRSRPVSRPSIRSANKLAGYWRASLTGRWQPDVETSGSMPPPCQGGNCRDAATG